MGWLKAAIDPRAEMAAADAAGERERYELGLRCGGTNGSRWLLDRETLGSIAPSIRTLLACVDALERRVRELEKSNS